ncbi:hypothetical protein [Compostimonas suwonensis]|uniref:Large exoprotein n=1 Tax=Compostimonas suwonensis TaxID=1048394 RepID=A0A2M9BVS0_9MICO|nr:hypothetical protein [Compostimonas suwonensis]PJJ62046.1 hypothetical protein CLV54_1838 [Compostimonas suwonensis]
MSADFLGGGIIVAIAALLWIAYLMPTWFRRRQYLATERNAVRLQQTLRVLAETAEVPDEVHVETRAREVSEQQRALRKAEARAKAESRAAADAAAAARLRLNTPARSARHRRTLRAWASLLLLASVAAFVAGLVMLMTGAPAWLLLGSLVTGTVAFVSLGRLAASARANRVAAPAAQRAPAAAFEPVSLGFEQEPAEAQTWTPQPLPKPLHLSRGTVAAAAMASADAAAELRKAAALAALEERAREAERSDGAVAAPRRLRPVQPVRPMQPRVERPAAASAASVSAAPVSAAPAAVTQSRFASMGIVGETEPGMSDLDDVLRRRRVAG